MPGSRRGQRPALDVDDRAAWHWRGLIKSFMDKAVQEEERNQCRTNDETEKSLRSQELQCYE